MNESTADISTVTGFFVRNSVSLRVGGELIEFTGVTKTAPYKFTGCKRGVAGTHKKLHSGGEKAYHMKEVYGRFVPDPESGLFKEIDLTRMVTMQNLFHDGGFSFMGVTEEVLNVMEK